MTELTDKAIEIFTEAERQSSELGSSINGTVRKKIVARKDLLDAEKLHNASDTSDLEDIFKTL